MQLLAASGNASVTFDNSAGSLYLEGPGFALHAERFDRHADEPFFWSERQGQARVIRLGAFLITASARR